MKALIVFVGKLLRPDGLFFTFRVCLDRLKGEGREGDENGNENNLQLFGSQMKKGPNENGIEKRTKIFIPNVG